MSGLLPTAQLAAWVRSNFKRPITATADWGHFCHALAHPGGYETVVWLAGDDYRRPDARGWMLANVAEALLRVERPGAMKAVAEHALSALPEDHSVWWHRKYLAWWAYRHGDFPKCAELCATIPDGAEYPGFDLEVLSVLAQLRLERSRRGRKALLAARLPMLVERRRQSSLNGWTAVPLSRTEFLRAVWCLDTLLIAIGRWGWRVPRVRRAVSTSRPRGRRRRQQESSATTSR